MRILHFCADLRECNGMANTARQFVAEEVSAGHDSHLTDRPEEIGVVKVCKEGRTSFSGIDVVHVHGAWLPSVHRVAKRAKEIGVKLVVRPAGSYDPVRLRYHAWKKLLMAPWEHAMLRRADIVQATCPQEAEWIRDYHPGAKVELIDLKRFFNLQEEVKSGGGERMGRPLHVLYLGRRHPLKGVKFLEKAVAELGPSCELRIESAVFGEAKEKTWEWCDVLCLPTLSENFGRVVAEALEHGRRVITTDGAPAWDPSGKVEGEGQGRQWRDRVLYLRGYRDGTDEERVKLLKEALARV